MVTASISARRPRAIVNAAEDRGIPPSACSTTATWSRLGYGAAMRRIWTAETDQTSAIAETISRDKDLTKELISSCGVPIPEGREVTSAADAWDAAEDIGLPVCVKPTDGNHGRGVFIDLKTREEVAKAYSIAIDEGSGVLVERSIRGHRTSPAGDRRQADRRQPQRHDHGDRRGQVDRLELIDTQINTDPRRGSTELHPLSIIHIDSAARMELAPKARTRRRSGRAAKS
jgi:cyanophycin synthetase